MDDYLSRCSNKEYENFFGCSFDWGGDHSDNKNQEVINADGATTGWDEPTAEFFANDFLDWCSPEEMDKFFGGSISLGTPGRDFPRKLPDETPWEAPSFTASSEPRERYTPLEQLALNEYTELCFASLEPSPDGWYILLVIIYSS